MKERLMRSIMGWLASFTIALIIVFVIKTFIGMPTTVKGTSMAGTLYPNDKLFLSTWDVNFNNIPDRGTIITFQAPSVEILDDISDCRAIYSSNSRSLWEKFLYYSLGISNSSYIKRVIGLPGDHIEIKNDCVYINGNLYEEDYLADSVKTNMRTGGICSDIVVPDGCVYVLGDNRNASIDSRKFGCVPVGKIEGKVIGRWWPANKTGAV
ncbi:MAG: signal peptidase I [Clostridia bacterium]|nr:signal peptidase I [Clostridia bacterium]